MIRPTGRPETTTATRRRRNDRGLTTLEWLLIVAAVAGLAALAVVLVQNVVDDTAEQISGSSARLTAANVAAAEITSESQESGADLSSLQAKCDRLRITYGDAFDDDPKKKPEWYLATGNGKIHNTDRTPDIGGDTDTALATVKADDGLCIVIDDTQT